MRFERMEFPEAVETLAKKAGVSLPEFQPQDHKAVNLATQLYKINELAMQFYAEALRTEAGKPAQQYLLKRGISQETIREFKLGLAPDKWDGVLTFLRTKQVSLGLLEKAGLIVPKDNGGYYDRFRNRAVFPVFDIKNRVLGFGARVFDTSLPKYINSPETLIYTKGKNLYGLNFAKDAIRENDCVVVVEGYLDCIMPYQAGFKNIVASLGTALTLEQVRLLKRYTHNVIMLYDADLAGQMATLRSLDVFVEEGLEVKVVSLPEGMDPDLFVRKFGLEEFKAKIFHAESLFDYKLKFLKTRHNPAQTEGKAKISSEMLATISKFKHAVLRSEYTRRLAEELHIREEALLQELNAINPDKPYAQGTHTAPPAHTAPAHPTERLLVQLMLEESELINRIKLSLAPGDFQDEKISRIVSLLFDLVGEGKHIDPRSVVNYLEDESSIKMVCESAFSFEYPQDQKEKVVDDCIQRLKHQKLKNKKQVLHEAIKSAQSAGDQEELQRLVQEFDELIKMYR